MNKENIVNIVLLHVVIKRIAIIFVVIYIDLMIIIQSNKTQI